MFKQRTLFKENLIYFISFMIREESGKKKKKAGAEEDGGRMMVYVGNSAKKLKMVSILMDMLIGLRRKERGVRIFECSEAAVHLNRPLAVHVDGESCYCQQDLEVRCIPKRIRMIGS